MPIWNPPCGGDEHESVHQTYVDHLNLILGELLPPLEGPNDAWGTVLSDLLGTTVRRLESQATSHGRRVKAVAAQLDALGVPEGLPAATDDAADPPLIELETAGGDTGPVAQMVVEQAPDNGPVTRTAVDPHEPTDVYAWSFAETRPAWHHKAVEWSGEGVVNLQAYESLAAFLAVRQAEPLPDPPADPSRPDIY